MIELAISAPARTDDRVEHAMAHRRIGEARQCLDTGIPISREASIGAGDIGSHAGCQFRHLIQLDRRRHGEDFPLTAACAAQSNRDHLDMIAVTDDLEVAIGPVDLPKQIGASRQSAAKMNRRSHTARQRTGDPDMVCDVTDH